MKVNINIFFDSRNGYLPVYIEHLVMSPLIVVYGRDDDAADAHPESSTGVDDYSDVIECQLTGIELDDGFRVDLRLGAGELESRGDILLRLDHIIRENSDRRRSSALVDENTRTATVQDRSGSFLRRER